MSWTMPGTISAWSEPAHAVEHSLRLVAPVPASKNFSLLLVTNAVWIRVSYRKATDRGQVPYVEAGTAGQAQSSQPNTRPGHHRWPHSHGTCALKQLGGRSKESKHPGLPRSVIFFRNDHYGRPAGRVPVIHYPTQVV